MHAVVRAHAGQIKFRKAAVVDTMHRIDAVCRSLKDSLDAKDLTAEVRSELKAKLEQREKQLLPIYHQVQCRAQM